jgi:phosphoserine phosphatase
MPWLENKGLLSLEGLDPAITPIATIKGESLWNYYQRLCDIDDSIGYLWVCQVFEGLSLAMLRENIREVFDEVRPIPTTRIIQGENVEVAVHPPKVFRAQIELIQTLTTAGVEVWVVSAALEELVRMVAADPAYGLNVPAERVIGVNLLMKNSDDSLRVSAHDRQVLRGYQSYFSPERLEATLTHHLFAPATWYQGKVSAIRKWIAHSKAPLLVAGDSQNDLPMLFEVEGTGKGIRLWVDRKTKYRDAAIAQAKRRGQLMDEAHGWLLMTPQALHGVAPRSSP